MMTIIGFVVLGIVVIFIGACILYYVGFNIDFFPLSFLVVVLSTLIIGAGLVIPFIPVMKSDSADETLNIQACKKIGGSYEVIDKTWNGKFYTNIYGCIKK